MTGLPYIVEKESACAELRVRLRPSEYSAVSKASRAAGSSIPDYARNMLATRMRVVSDADIAAWIVGGFSWAEIQKRFPVSDIELAKATGRIADALAERLKDQA